MNQLYKVFGLLALVLGITHICIGKSESQLRLGKAVNIFIRYGYLSISMKVISYNDTETWLFKEPTVNIFKGIESQGIPSISQETPSYLNGEFHMEFCDNRRQLFQAYFRNFTIEQLDRPWRAFTGGWHNDIAARKLGINASFISGDYCYVLVRVSRYRDSAKLRKPIPPNQVLENDITARIRNVTPGDTTGTVQFMNRYGTHYVNSYVTGNSLYQVFVYTKKNYQLLKERLKTRGVSALSREDLYNYFAPWYAEHLGQIRCASGNSTVERWASRKLRLSYYIFTYASLLKIHGNVSLLNTLNTILGNEAILQLELKSIDVIFKDPIKKVWFREIIDNYLKLWEVNM